VVRRLFLFALLLVACDPVSADEKDALGGEAPGVRRGPEHRPGQPCLVCHTGEPGDPPQFSVAGTVYQTSGAVVKLTDSTGKTATKTTNSAGNFYLLPNEFTPVYPMKAEVTYAGITAVMSSRIGRDGSCATCHFDPAGPKSAGHIYIPPDGGAP
jgi:hypothetical protein